MFFSCHKHDSCGIYKDNQAGEFKLADIIDPSRENPEDFFQYDSQGNILPRKDLTNAQRKRAEETIRIFNLNCPRLKSIRLKAVEAVAFFLQNSIAPNPKQIKDYLEMLPNDIDCISVYRVLLKK